jgi:hypothetical protein
MFMIESEWPLDRRTAERQTSERRRVEVSADRNGDLFGVRRRNTGLLPSSGNGKKRNLFYACRGTECSAPGFLDSHDT